MYNYYSVQWNLSITDTLRPDIFGHFLLQYRGFTLSEAKNVLVTSAFWNQNFYPHCGGFLYCVLNFEGLLREVPMYTAVYLQNNFVRSLLYKSLTGCYVY